MRLAVISGNYDKVVDILSSDDNANINNYYTSGTVSSPLALAVIFGKYKIVKLLLEHGADPNIKDDEGKTPLDHAILLKESNIINLLLDHNSKMNDYSRVKLSELSFEINLTEKFLNDGFIVNISNIAKKYSIISLIMSKKIKTARAIIENFNKFDKTDMRKVKLINKYPHRLELKVFEIAFDEHLKYENADIKILIDMIKLFYKSDNIIIFTLASIGIKLYNIKLIREMCEHNIIMNRYYDDFNIRLCIVGLIICAIKSNAFDIFKILLDARVKQYPHLKFDWYEYMIISLNADLKYFRTLLDYGASPDSRSGKKIILIEKYFFTLLITYHKACFGLGIERWLFCLWQHVLKMERHYFHVNMLI